MKKLTLILSLMFSVMLSSPSYAKWTKVNDGVSGNTFYIDLERIRKVDGYVYWWDLANYLKPTNTGMLSSKQYRQGDCKLFRYKYLSDNYFSLPMGKGDVKGGSNIPDKNWRYAPPKSAGEKILKSVCSR